MIQRGGVGGVVGHAQIFPSVGGVWPTGRGVEDTPIIKAGNSSSNLHYLHGNPLNEV